MAELVSLVYVSTAAHLPTAREVAYLLERAQLRNAEVAVTGVLLYSEGTFMQCLEGSEEAVNHVMGFIRADPLHHSVFEMIRDPIEQREFTAWSMAFRSTWPGSRTLIGSHEASASLTERLGTPPGTDSSARHLLKSFWNGGFAHSSFVPLSA